MTKEDFEKMMEQMTNAISGAISFAGQTNHTKNLTDTLSKRVDSLVDMSKFVDWQFKFRNAVMAVNPAVHDLIVHAEQKTEPYDFNKEYASDPAAIQTNYQLSQVRLLTW